MHYTNFIKTLKNLFPILWIVIGAFLLAISMHIFTIPAKFAPGGISGLSSIIQIVSGFPAGYSMIILNAPLIILAFFMLSKKFTMLSILGIGLTSAFLQLFDVIHLYEFYNPNETIISAIAGGILSGAGIGIMVKAGGSSGGTEIMSMLIQKKITSLSMSWIVFGINVVIICLGGALYYGVMAMDITTVISIMLFSFMQVFLSSKSMDVILNGMSSAVKFEVVTNHPKELSEAICAKMNRGVTIINSRGAFTNEENAVLICIVTRIQISQFKKVLKDTDPSAFAFAMDTREVLGTGFKTKQ